MNTFKTHAILNIGGKIVETHGEINMDVREAIRNDIPRSPSNEAQCNICWRMFTNDISCEAHKSYSNPITERCKPPESLGMEYTPRRGIKIWARLTSSAPVIQDSHETLLEEPETTPELSFGSESIPNSQDLLPAATRQPPTPPAVPSWIPKPKTI